MPDLKYRIACLGLMSALLMADASAQQGDVRMERIEYKGWPNCLRLSNGIVELVVTTDVGPRIIRFGFVGGDNIFKEYEDMMGKTGGTQWRIYGGHRLWIAPEAKPRSYHPDNFPVKHEAITNGVRLVQPVESTTGIQKEMEITLSPKEAQVTVTHRLRNMNQLQVECAPWALSVMAPGTKVIIPLPPRGTHQENLLPTSVLALWAYTDLTDKRWTLGKRYIMLQQDANMKSPQKIGAMVPDGWAAAVRNGSLFVKKFAHLKGAVYPDFGSTVETFTNGEMIELETLGPLARLEPEATISHVEHWFLFRDVKTPMSDDEVDLNVLPKVKTAVIR